MPFFSLFFPSREMFGHFALINFFLASTHLRPLVKVKLSDWTEKQLYCLFMFCAFVIKRKIQINHFSAYKISEPPSASSIDGFNLIPSHHKSPPVIMKYTNSCLKTQNFSEGISFFPVPSLVTPHRSFSFTTFSLRLVNFNSPKG